MAVTLRPLRVTRGRHLATVSFEIICNALLVGHEYVAEFDHSALAVDGDATLKAVFADNPMPVVDAAPGFRIAPLVNGTDGGKFRIGITWKPSEYVHSATDGIMYGTGDEDAEYVSDADGTITLQGTRTGHLADGA